MLRCAAPVARARAAAGPTGGLTHVAAAIAAAAEARSLVCMAACHRRGVHLTCVPLQAGGRLLLSRLTAPASPAHLPCGELPSSALPRWGLFLQQYISIKLLSMNEMREAERGGRGHCHSCLALVRIIGGAEVTSPRRPGGARSPGGASRAAVLYVGGCLSPGMGGGAGGRCAERGRVVRVRVSSGAGRRGASREGGGGGGVQIVRWRHSLLR